MRWPRKGRRAGGLPSRRVACSTAEARSSKPATGHTTRPGPRKRVAGPPVARSGPEKSRATSASASLARTTCRSSSSPKKRSVTCHCSRLDQRACGAGGRGRPERASSTPGGGQTATKQRTQGKLARCWRAPSAVGRARRRQGRSGTGPRANLLRPLREQAGGDPLNRSSLLNPTVPAPAQAGLRSWGERATEVLRAHLRVPDERA